MSACAAVHPQLPAFVAGELSSSARAQVRQHLHQCCQCRGEAGLLQRAQSALGELRNEAVDPRHEAMFADLHQAIVASTVAAPPFRPVGAADSRTAGPSARVVAAAAAALLLSVGFLIGAGAGGESGLATPGVSFRPPVVAMTTAAAGRDAIVVVPYAGPRVELRPLGFDRAAAEVQDPFGRTDGAGAAGLLARRRLRTLVEEGAPIPPVEPERASTVGADTTPR